MIEEIKQLKGAIISSVIVEDDNDADSDDYCPYQIVIKTNQGSFRISGCHDSGPEIKEIQCWKPY